MSKILSKTRLTLGCKNSPLRENAWTPCVICGDITKCECKDITIRCPVCLSSDEYPQKDIGERCKHCNGISDDKSSESAEICHGRIVLNSGQILKCNTCGMPPKYYNAKNGDKCIRTIPQICDHIGIFIQHTFAEQLLRAGRMKESQPPDDFDDCSWVNPNILDPEEVRRAVQ